MNELLDARYDEIVHRLAAGVEPVDALGGARAGDAVRLELESPARTAWARPLAHAGGRWSIRYANGLPDHVDVRIGADGRRYVPRRLRLPVASLAAVIAGDGGGPAVTAAKRTWRPALFPGASYPVGVGATGLRGRASHAGAPARWVRVEARPVGAPATLWRAHGDERGEFLLVIGPDPDAPAALPPTIAVIVDLFAADPAAMPPAGAAVDPLWGLPLETVSPPGPDDPVSRGAALPPGYAAGIGTSANVDLVPGRIRADLAPFDLV